MPIFGKSATRRYEELGGAFEPNWIDANTRSMAFEPDRATEFVNSSRQDGEAAPHGQMTFMVVSHTHWDREWYQPFDLEPNEITTLLFAS